VSAITTHVLDTARGVPAAGVPVRLEHSGTAGWTQIGAASTDEDGRVRQIGPADIATGTYRLVFDTDSYAAQQSGDREPVFFPEVTVTFAVHDQARNYHVPLLLSPYGFSTYRGS
jgi:5-hydroxyisourate hydrolase